VIQSLPVALLHHPVVGSGSRHLTWVPAVLRDQLGPRSFFPPSAWRNLFIRADKARCAIHVARAVIFGHLRVRAERMRPNDLAAGIGVPGQICTKSKEKNWNVISPGGYT